MKKFLIINTGGTFSSVATLQGLAPGICADKILSLLGEEKNQYLIDTQDYASLDSANILPEDWVGIAHLIQENIQAYDGIIIIHGTDTMAYTASMLSFMCMYAPIPIVLTGSQLSISAPLTDAIDNLRCAIKMADIGSGGVYVAFNRKIMLGCRTAKVRTISFDAFESINYPLVAESNAMGMMLYPQHHPIQGTFAFTPTFCNDVAVIKHFPGMNAEILPFLLEKGYRGFFIEGFGLGGVPFIQKDGMLKEICKASEAGIPILVGSQCRYEGSNLDVYETGKRVKECGGIPVHDMSQEATITKLMWALGKTEDRVEIERLFMTNLTNEVSL